jgi:hypothetical protein
LLLLEATGEIAPSRRETRFADAQSFTCSSRRRLGVSRDAGPLMLSAATT